MEEVVSPLQRLYSLWALLKRHKWKSILAFIVIGLLTRGYFALTSPAKPELITAEATRGRLVQTVEAVGTVTSERDLQLQFPVSGVVEEVLVKEGDKVEAGQRLAALRARDLAANVSSALASLEAANADLRELQEGTRPEDIAIAEAEVANKRAALQAARETLLSAEAKLRILEQEADTSLAGHVTTARSTITQDLTTAVSSLSVMEDVFEDREVQDALLKDNPGEDQQIKNKRIDSEDAIQNVLIYDLQFSEYKGALTSLQRARSAAARASEILSRAFSTIVNLRPTGAYTSSERETHKKTLTTERKNVQDALASLDSAIKALQDDAANFDTQIANEEKTITNAQSDILNNETAVRTQEAQLALKRAGSRQTDIDAAAARVRQASADLARARADFEDTILYAPSDGFITKVNIKTGELLSTAFQQDAAITMLGESPYRIEMYASEIDIPKVELQQEAEVELDAFPNAPFSLVVAEVDPAATDIDGVPKYRIKLDFIGDTDRLKIGMTGDVDIFTGMREDVIMVPARAVIENANGETIVRVINGKETFEEKTVEVGMEGESDVEIISGIEEGETVVVLVKKK